MKALAYLTPAFIRSHHTCENHRGVSMVYAKDPAIFQAQVPPLDVAQLMKALAQALCRWNRRRDHADRHWSCRLLRECRERPHGRAAEQRDELAPFHCAIPPVRSTQRIAHVSYGGRLLRCGSQVEPDAQAWAIVRKGIEKRGGSTGGEAVSPAKGGAAALPPQRARGAAGE